MHIPRHEVDVYFFLSTLQQMAVECLEEGATLHSQARLT